MFQEPSERRRNFYVKCLNQIASISFTLDASHHTEKFVFPDLDHVNWCLLPEVSEFLEVKPPLFRPSPLRARWKSAIAF